MAISNTNTAKAFMYSEMQIKERKNANKNVNRKFVCGKVSIGSNMKEYSSIVDMDMIATFTRQYPDAKIIYKGYLNNIKYTDIDEEFIGR